LDEPPKPMKKHRGRVSSKYIWAHLRRLIFKTSSMKNHWGCLSIKNS